MKLITIFLLKDNNINEYYDEIEFIEYSKDSFIVDLENAQGKYITFIKDYNNITDDYYNKIIGMAYKEFDSCFLNYTINIDGKMTSIEEIDEPEICIRPYPGDYIWAYMYKKDKLMRVINDKEITSQTIDNTFIKTSYIREVLYRHTPSKRIINDLVFSDEKDIERYKNVFYLGNYVNGQFNGYITWLNNIGRCFSDNYDMTIIYDKIYEPTKKAFERYFRVIERKENTLYCSDRLFVTYSTYYYPKNILCLEENYMFVHGNMTDYQNVRKYKYDNYTKYIGVSQACAKRAKGYFPTDEIIGIFNPIKIDYNEVKPHLKLVSAQRNDPIKKGERIHVIAGILDEENIPYTWNVFTDVCPYPSRVYGGVIYRDSVQNVLPYTNDCDYYVQLSDSESCSYSVLEALSLNTKVILTPLECYQEMSIDDSQAVIIPFEYFEPENKEKLREVILKIYRDKDNKMQNKLSSDLYKGYLDLLKK